MSALEGAPPGGAMSPAGQPLRRSPEILSLLQELYLAREVSEVLSRFASVLEVAVRCDQISLALLEPAVSRLRVLDLEPGARSFGPERSLPVGGTLAAAAFRERRLQCWTRGHAPEPLSPLFRRLPISAVVVPLLLGQRPLGTLNLGSDSLELGEGAVAAALAPLVPHLVVALDNAAAYRRARSAEDRYRTLLDRAVDPTFILDLDRRSLVEVNARALELTGYRRSELIAMDWEELGTRLVGLPWRRVLRVALGGEQANEDAELLQADGNLLPVELRASLVRAGHDRVLLCEIRDRSRSEGHEQVHDFSRAVVESANTFLCTLDEHGRVGIFNAKFQETTGLSHQEVRGAPAGRWIDGDVEELFARRIREAFAGDRLEHFELPVLAADGSRVLLSVSSSLVGEGQARKLLLVGTDITEAKRFESRLVESEKQSKSAYQQLREFSAVSSTILQEIDLDRICGMFVQALREHSNFRRAILTLLDDEFKGYKWFFSGLDQEEIDIFHQSRLSGNQRVTIFQERFRLGNSYYIPHDAKWDYVGVPSNRQTVEMHDWNPEDFLFIPLYGANRKMVGIVSVDDPRNGARPTAATTSPIELFANQVAHAIEQAKLNQEVRRSTEKYRTLVESMNDGLLAVDLMNQVTFVNPALLDLLGYPEHALLQRRIHKFLSDEDQRLFRKEVLQRERRARFEVSLIPKEGEPIPVMVSSAPFYQNGKLVGTFAIISDLREHKKADLEFKNMHNEIVESNKLLQQSMKDLQSMQEQLVQAEKLSALGELISGVAHELNNPLTGVMGYSQLLLGSDCSQDIKDSLEKIHREANRCENIVKNLLMFARRQDPEKRLVSINEVLDATLDLRRYQLRVDNIEIAREFDERLPRTSGNFHQLEQVFLNIVNNAHQAMLEAHGRGRLLVRTESDRDWIRVHFQDDGPGVPEDKINKIFDPFFTTKEPGKGTGLGLSLSYGIVRDHDGKISVRSTYGGGTTFVVELPVRKPAEAEPEEEVVVVEAVAPGTARILVVDDEEVILDLLQSILTTAGHHVETAGNGRLALEMLRKGTYDVIISDLKMPDIGGQVLWESVHAIDPELSKRMVFSTGDTVNPSTQAFFQRTGNHYLAKPFRLEDVEETVRMVLAELQPSGS